MGADTGSTLRAFGQQVHRAVAYTFSTLRVLVSSASSSRVHWLETAAFGWQFLCAACLCWHDIAVATAVARRLEIASFQKGKCRGAVSHARAAAAAAAAVSVHTWFSNGKPFGSSINLAMRKHSATYI